MAYSANSTKISAKVGSATQYAEIANLMEVPEFGGTPEKIDVTVLSDTTKKYIPGIKDYGDLVFKFLYESGADGNYSKLAGYAKDNTPVDFKLTYPDGSSHSFTAVPAVKMDAGAINGALTFSVTMMLQSDITVAQEA